METEGSLSYPEMRAIATYYEVSESSSHPVPVRSFSLRFFDQNFVRISLFPHAYYMPLLPYFLISSPIVTLISARFCFMKFEVRAVSVKDCGFCDKTR
jgi:hypothetical protein